MEKRITLKLYGDVNQGFQAVLAIHLDQQLEVEVSGQLPPPVELVQCFEQWQESYRALGQSYRALKPKSAKRLSPLSRRKQECQRLAKALQHALNAWLKTESFANIREKWSQKMTTQDTIQLMIRAEDVRIWQLPWHLWELLDQYPLEIGFSVLNYDYPAITQTRSPAPTVDQPLSILAILGHSAGIDVERDRHLLEQLPGATTEFLVEPPRQSLSHQLWNQRWDILFFAGHSQTEQENGRIFLNPDDSLSLDELKAGLRQAVSQGLQLAIFNSCDGLGLVQELEPLQIPTIIVMREPVPDQVAQDFLRNFLHAFSNGVPFYKAVQQARQRLEGLQDDFPCATWLPMIWQNPAATPLQWRQVRSPAQIRADRLWKPLSRVVGVSLAIALSVIGIRTAGILQSVEVWTFDQFQRLQPEEKPDDRLLLVEITENDLQNYGYPIPDAILAQLLQKLEAAEPRVIGLDVLRDLPQPPGHQEWVQQLQQSDRLIAICQHDQLDATGTPPPPSIPPERVGFSDVVLDPNDVIRRHLMALSFDSSSGCQASLSLSFQLALAYLQPQGITPEVTADNRLKLGAITLAPLDLPAGGYQTADFADLAGFQLLLNYRRYDGSLNHIAQRVSLGDVLQGRVDARVIQNRIVLIGVTASSIKDDFNTPTGEKLRGLVIHAQMVSQLLSAVLDGRSLLWVWGRWGDVLWIVGWSMVGGAVAWGMHQRLRRSLSYLAHISILGILVVVCYGVFLVGGWIPLIPSAIAYTLSHFGCSLYFQSQSRSTSRLIRPSLEV